MFGRAIAIALLGATALAAATAGRPATSAAAPLLARYEPVLRLYRADWKPTAVEPFLAAADLQRLTGGSWRLVRHSPPASALAHGSRLLRLDTRGCSPARDLDRCYAHRATPATVYGRVWVNPTASARIATVLQYWLFYSLDDWRNSPSAPVLWHMHEGDWEEVSVALDSAGQPVSVAASQHDLGVVRAWAQTRRSGGTHLNVYVALGSHANYLSPGSRGAAGVPHVIPPRFSGLPLPEPDYTSAQTSVGPGGSWRLRIADVSSGTAPWLSFAGAWGDGSYLLAGSAKGAITHLRIGDSPPGPAFHAVWRDPLLQFANWPADDGH